MTTRFSFVIAALAAVCLAAAATAPAKAQSGYGLLTSGQYCWVERQFIHGQMAIWVDVEGTGLNRPEHAHPGSYFLNKYQNGTVDNGGKTIFLGDRNSDYSIQRVPCPPPASFVQINLNSGYLNSTTKITSADVYTVRDNATVLQLSGSGSYGLWYLGGQVFGGAPQNSSNFNDVFPSFPALNYSGTANNGMVWGFTGDAGVNIFQQPGFSAQVFGGIHVFSEQLSGTITNPLFPGNISVINDRWEAARIGGQFEKTFLDGNASIAVTIVGLPYTTLQSGAFKGNGSGYQGGVTLVLPIRGVPGLAANFFVQGSHMTASGTVTGEPLSFTNNNVMAGGGITYQPYVLNQHPDVYGGRQ